MKKQFVLAAVVLATVFSFVSCGDKKPEETTTEPVATEAPAEDTTATAATPAADTTETAAATDTVAKQ